jgi:O-antigen/teichoic acid export membrane protein
MNAKMHECKNAPVHSAFFLHSELTERLFRRPAHSAHARIARMSASFLGSNLVRAAIGFVTSLVIGRGLGPGEFGRWIFFTAWASTLTVAFDLGLSALVTRDAARDEAGRGRLVAGALAVRLAVFAPAGFLVYSAASWIGGGPASAASLRVAVWLAAAGLAYGCFAALFRASPRWLIAILTIETAGAALQCAGALWIIAHNGGVIHLLRVATAVQILQVATAFVLWRFTARGGRLQWPSWRSGWLLLRRAYPFAVAGAVVNIQSRLAPLMLGYMAGAADVAAFGAAAKLGSAARMLPHAGFAAALPVLSHEVAHGEPEPVRTGFDGYVRWFAIVAATCLLVGARPILRFTYGASFASAAPALAWIAVGLVPSLVNNARKVYLYASGRERMAVQWTSVSVAVQAIGSLALVPSFSAAGAACAMALGEAAVWWPLRMAVRTPGIHEVRPEPAGAWLESSR